MKWTPEQEQILRIYGHRGAEYCRNLIFRQFGVFRSVSATQRHASRIHALMTRYQICPACGKASKSLNRITGICDACNYEMLWRRQVEEQQRIITRLLKGGDGEDESKARRRYDAERKKTSRLRAKVFGDSVDMSSEMSSRRSEPSEIFSEPPEKELRASA